MSAFLRDVGQDLFDQAVADSAAIVERREAARRELAALREREGSESRRVADYLSKNAARLYRDRPALLDAIAHGLSFATPGMMIALVREEARKAARIPWGKVEIVPVVAVNHRGAVIYARWLRRFGERPEAFATAAE